MFVFSCRGYELGFIVLVYNYIKLFYIILLKCKIQCFVFKTMQRKSIILIFFVVFFCIIFDFDSIYVFFQIVQVNNIYLKFIYKILYVLC